MRTFSRAVVVVAVIAATAAMSPVAEASAKTPLNVNLIKNPSFEAGSASTDGNQVVSIPKWHKSDGTATVVRYGTAGGFPTKAQGNAVNGAKKFLSMGLTDGGFCDTVFQRVTVTGRNVAIDAGRMRVDAYVYAGTYDSQTDTAYQYLEFYGAGSQFIDSTETNQVAQTNGEFFPMAFSVPVPAGTRSIRMILGGDSPQGAYCDAYFDRASLDLAVSN